MSKLTRWIPLWLLLSFFTATGWLIAWFTTFSVTFASGIWDPDEIEAYLSRSPWQHLLDALLGGAVAGIALAMFAGVLLVVSRHNIRRTVLPVLSIVIGTSFLCALVQVGPNDVRQITPWTMLRLGMAGGAVGGIFTGLFQWILLSRRVPALDRWVFLTTISWMAAWAAVWTIAGQPSLHIHIGNRYIPALAVGGLIAGLGPYLITGRICERAGWIIAGSAAGWTTAALMAYLPGQIVLGAIVQGLIVSGTLVAVLRPWCHRNESPLTPD